VAVHRQPEGIDFDLGRDDGPVPAYKKPVVRRQDRLIEHFEGRFKQWRSGALQDECPFWGKAVVIVRSSGPPGRRSLTTVSANAGTESVPGSGPRRYRETAAA